MTLSKSEKSKATKSKATKSKATKSKATKSKSTARKSTGSKSTGSNSTKNKSLSPKSTKDESVRPSLEHGEETTPVARPRSTKERARSEGELDASPVTSPVDEQELASLTKVEPPLENSAALLHLPASGIEQTEPMSSPDQLTDVSLEQQLATSRGAASFWRRLFAFLFDLLFLLTFGALVAGTALAYSIFMFSEPITNGKLFSINEIENLLFLTLTLIIVLSWLYLTALDSMKPCATLGKLMFKIQVAHENGRGLSWLRSNLRLLAAGLSILTLGLGFILALFRKDRRMLHDIISKTRVAQTQLLGD